MTLFKRGIQRFLIDPKIAENLIVSTPRLVDRVSVCEAGGFEARYGRIFFSFGQKLLRSNVPYGFFGTVRLPDFFFQLIQFFFHVLSFDRSCF